MRILSSMPGRRASPRGVTRMKAREHPLPIGLFSLCARHMTGL